MVNYINFLTLGLIKDQTLELELCCRCKKIL